MFKVILADDEKIILEGVRALIDWEALGYTVCAAAKNGEELISLTEEHNPHLIITDIQMPKLNGIDAISQLRAQGFENEIILLTGFAEFEYAKSALENGSAAYLMKPVDEEELTSHLKKIALKLTEAEEAAWHEEAAYLHKVGMQSADDYIIPPSTLSVDDKFSVIAVEYVFRDIEDYEQIESFKELTEKVKQSIQKPQDDLFDVLRRWTKTELDCGSWITAARNGYFIFINSEPLKYISKIQEFFGNRVNIRVLVSETSTGLFSLSDCMLSLEPIRYKYFYAPETERIFMASEKKQDTSSVIYEHPNIEQICSYAFTARFEDSVAMLKEAEQRLIDNKNPPPIVEAYVNLLITRLALFMDEHFYMGHELYILGEALKPIVSRSRIRQLTEVLVKTLELVNIVVQNAAKDADMGIVKNVILYLKEHYNEKITIKTVSERYFINTAYLGQLFKRKVGASFHDYLAQLRMERAKQLLATSSKSIADISSEIGFEDPNYFSARFGKTEGMTPREYRAKMQEK